MAIKMLDHDYIFVVYIDNTLVEQSSDGFDVVVRKNYKLKEKEWSLPWIDMPQDLYNNFKSWLFDWIFQQVLEDIATAATGTGDVQGQVGGIQGPAGPKKKKKKMVRRFSLRKSNILKNMGI